MGVAARLRDFLVLALVAFGLLVCAPPARADEFVLNRHLPTLRSLAPRVQVQAAAPTAAPAAAPAVEPICDIFANGYDQVGATQCAGCFDATFNFTETDVDCGGVYCKACADGQHCAVGSDCSSTVCNSATTVCAPAACADNIQDGSESDVDCGGASCPACIVGLKCNANNDCASNACDGISHTCVADQCQDHHKDGTESGIDCGGGNCPVCANGLGCSVDSDCASDACDGLTMTCVSDQCADHRLDGAETGVDCGGGTCSTCTDGLGCHANSDCASNACDALSLTCISNQCADHRLDGSETGVDCGGGTCSACTIGLGCSANSDCTSNACDAISHTCIANQCMDHSKDGAETDIDCGGGTCPACAVGKQCTLDGDCTTVVCDFISGRCVTGLCFDERKDGSETDIDCGGGTCAKCANAKNCTVNSDCNSDACDAFSFKCIANQCADHHKDGTETDVDCGGGICSACAFGMGCSADSDCTSNACDTISHSCTASQCTDNHQDGFETDVDCGGINSCNRCIVGRKCLANSDCSAGHVCNASQRCQ